MLQSFRDIEGYKVLKVLIEKIEPYLQAQGVNEMIVNREKEVWLMRGSDFECVSAPELDSKTLLTLCEQLASYRDFYFNSQVPHLACSIPQTRYRVNALHPSITPNNEIAICIRVPSNRQFKIQEFVLGERCQYGYDEIEGMVKRGENILISGGTASGKTSLLNALIDFIPLTDRILSVEDSPELNLEKYQNRVQILVGKNENTNFTYENALNNAMRMSPQRLMVGEIDTRNAMLFLRFGNTGHRGMVSTIHANSVDSVIEAIALNIKISNTAEMDLDVIRDFFKSAIDVVIQINKIGHQRVIQEIKYTKEL